MSTVLSKQRMAPDVLKAEQKWSEKLVSMAGMLNHKYLSPWLQKPPVASAGAIQTPTAAVIYPHIFKLHMDDGNFWVFVASSETYSIWRCHCSEKTGAFSTELVVSGSDVRIIDGCICTSREGDCCYYTVTDLSEGDSKSFLVKKRYVQTDSGQETTCAAASAQFSGDVVSISAENRYVVLAQTGMLKLLCRESLHVFADIPSMPGAPTIFASSNRWFAVQIAQSQHKISGTEATSSSDTDFNVAARKLVSGAYTLGKAGWERIGPIVYQMYKQGNDSNHQHETHTVETSKATNGGGATAFVGGAVAVFDAATSTASSDESGKEEKLSISLNVVCKFLAHNEDLELLSFSPSGTMVASASSSGQVIHIHALTSAALLFSSAAKSISIKNRKRAYDQTPQLVYRLVRGLSLATVNHVSFDAVESMVVVGTNNGTMHVFDLDRRNTSAGLGVLGASSEVSPISTTDINNSKNSTSSTIGASSFTGSEVSSSAGSAPSSVPLSNIDELLSQFASQKALDGDDSSEAGMKYLKSLVKELYPSRRMRLAARDYANTSDGEIPVEENGGKAPTGISFSKAASAAASVGYSSVTSVISIQNMNCMNSNISARGNVDSHEIVTLTAQGMLSRFRLPTISKAIVANGNGTGGRFGSTTLSIAQLSNGINGFVSGSNHYSFEPVELNRWDLFAPLEESEEYGSSIHGDSKSSSGESSPTSTVNAASWLYAFGDIRGASGNGVNPLWTRPQVTFRSRLKQPSSAEKSSSSSKKQGSVSSSSSAPYSFLFPERTVSEPIKTNHHLKPSEEGGISILSTISSVLDSNPSGSDDPHSSGRRVAKKHIAATATVTSSGPPPSLDDWEVPSETDWAVEKDELSIDLTIDPYAL